MRLGVDSHPPNAQTLATGRVTRVCQGVPQSEQVLDHSETSIVAGVRPDFGPNLEERHSVHAGREASIFLGRSGGAGERKTMQATGR